LIEAVGLHPTFCGPLSTFLHSNLVSSSPLDWNFSKGQVFPTNCQAFSPPKKLWQNCGRIFLTKLLYRKVISAAILNKNSKIKKNEDYFNDEI